jgi:hypothetical protein
MQANSTPNSQPANKAKTGKSKAISSAADPKSKPVAIQNRQLGALRHMAEISDHLFDEDLKA